VLTVHDGDTPDGSSDRYAFHGGAPANTCATLTGITPFPIHNGNISVHD